jgi:tRNA (mo5U34)-methyltransferase
MTRQEIETLIKSKRWYHVIEVAPGILTPGPCDSRPHLDEMGFPADFSGKTVLDVGCRDGFYSFEAEKRGADRVVALDITPPDRFGFALARELLGSRVEYVKGSVYDLAPQIHGTFDVVLFLGVLYHLRHPLLALEKIHAVCRETLYLETHILDHYFLRGNEACDLESLHPALADAALMQFYPGNELNHDPSNWFAPTERCVEMMLRSSGFNPRLVKRWTDRVFFAAARGEFKNPEWYA